MRVWSGQSGRRVHTLTEHAGNAVAVAFSPDGEFVASASTDGTGRIWRTSDWGLSSSLTGHTNALTNVSFSADGEHVVTTGKDGTAQGLARRERRRALRAVGSSRLGRVRRVHRRRRQPGRHRERGRVDHAIWDGGLPAGARRARSTAGAPVTAIERRRRRCHASDDRGPASTRSHLATGERSVVGAVPRAAPSPSRRAGRSERDDSRAHRRPAPDGETDDSARSPRSRHVGRRSRRSEIVS